MTKARKSEDGSHRIIDTMPDDAEVEIFGKGLFINGTGEPVPTIEVVIEDEPVEVVTEGDK